MSSNKIAQAIEDAYVQANAPFEHLAKQKVNPIADMSMDTGVELMYLFSKFDTDCDPMTDWSSKIYEFEWLIEELLILIGKPGILQKLHPSVQKKASVRLMKLLNFFRSINEKNTTQDWLSWVALDQFSSGEDQDENDMHCLLRNLSVNHK